MQPSLTKYIKKQQHMTQIETATDDSRLITETGTDKSRLSN